VPDRMPFRPEREAIIEPLVRPEPPTLVELAAHHEASHAVAAVTLDIKFKALFIGDHDAYEGGMEFEETKPYLIADFSRDDAAHRRETEAWMLLALAGEAGEAYAADRPFDLQRPSAEEDVRIAFMCAWRLTDDVGEVKKLLFKHIANAVDFVRTPLRERQISVVANELAFMKRLPYLTVSALVQAIEANEQTFN
jgi:hypothetical protein